jgi:long-chain acyl-CoA synthetase
VTAFIALLNSDAMGRFDLASLTKVYTGGAPTPPGVLADWHARTGNAHPADVRPDGGDVADAHDAARRGARRVDPKTGVISIGVPCSTPTSAS